MARPTLTDYVNLLFTLFERFWQHHATHPHCGRPLVYEPKALIVFFVVMQQRRLMQVETARVSEQAVIDQQSEYLIHRVAPATLSADNSYAQARRIRQWAKHGVLLLTPAARWRRGRYAKAYHAYMDQPEQRTLLQSRRTAIEPIFDLMASALGSSGGQKPLPVQRLDNVRSCLALATLAVQVAMIANRIWGLPLRNISTMATALA